MPWMSSARMTSYSCTTTSTYPAKYEQLNLRAIPTMAERYGVPVGTPGMKQDSYFRRGQCPWCMLRRASHHGRPCDVGFGSGSLP